MSCGLRYSPMAVEDLRRMHAQIREISQDEDIALNYVDGLMQCLEDKRDFPHAGAPLSYDGGFTGYYFIIFKEYLAFYRVKDDCMYVDRVLYSRRDYMQALFLLKD